jgi:CheY-like chemotaxis protein
VPLTQVCADVEQTFRPLADQKGLTFSATVDDGTPPEIETDEQRLQQVLKNLLSNAVKFTEHGSVALSVGAAPAGIRFAHPALVAATADGGVLEFAVTDTGIGIPADKRLLIFEAFQQADGTTSRRFGGTGLGLSISREIAALLGGEIRVESTEGEGSRFALYLPASWYGGPRQQSVAAELVETHPVSLEPEVVEPEIEPAFADDRDNLEDGDRALLVITGDTEFATTATELGHERGFKVLVALRGDSGLALARELRPDAIVLDTALPGIDGLAVLEALKRQPQTRHIPVHVIASEEQRQTVLTSGALALMVRPVTADAMANALGEIGAFLDRRVRRLLVVEDNDRDRHAIIDLIGADDGDIEIVEASSSEEALSVLDEHDVDCMVLDLKLPKMTGFDLLERVKEDPRHARMPVVIYTGRDLTRREETRLKRYADAIIVKDARSPERLLDETSLFLHRVEARMPAAKRRMIQQLHSADAVFAGRHVLVVDDDVRNVFALTSALESRGMRVSFAENGREGIEQLDAHPDVDLVLMDIMMPELDGYETTRLIREQDRWAQLPIIALTAKAMKGDRERCIAAGASDYITKPVDIDQLLSLMRVWLYR